MRDFKIGEIVYHRSVYHHMEPLKVVGIREKELELEGNYSGGVDNSIQSQWMPIKGVSRIYNHAYKQLVRKNARNIELLALSSAGSKNNYYNEMMDMVNAVMTLTKEVELNPEF